MCPGATYQFHWLTYCVRDILTIYKVVGLMGNIEMRFKLMHQMMTNWLIGHTGIFSIGIDCFSYDTDDTVFKNIVVKNLIWKFCKHKHHFAYWYQPLAMHENYNISSLDSQISCRCITFRIALVVYTFKTNHMCMSDFLGHINWRSVALECKILWLK